MIALRLSSTVKKILQLKNNLYVRTVIGKVNLELLSLHPILTNWTRNLRKITIFLIEEEIGNLIEKLIDLNSGNALHRRATLSLSKEVIIL